MGRFQQNDLQERSRERRERLAKADEVDREEEKRKVRERRSKRRKALTMQATESLTPLDLALHPKVVESPSFDWDAVTWRDGDSGGELSEPEAFVQATPDQVADARAVLTNQAQRQHRYRARLLNGLAAGDAHALEMRHRRKIRETNAWRSRAPTYSRSRPKERRGLVLLPKRVPRP